MIDLFEISSLMRSAGLARCARFVRGANSDLRKLMDHYRTRKTIKGLSKYLASMGYPKYLADSFAMGEHEWQEIDLTRTSVYDLEPLARYAKSAKFVYLNNCNVSDIGPLSELKNMRKLDLYETPVSDLGPLSGLTSLERLRLSYTKVKNLSPLSGLTNLKRLELCVTPVSDLGPLSGLTGLRELWLSGSSGVSDLGPLSGLTGLRNLGLGETDVSDLSPLSGLTKLEQLELEDTNVTDLSPLKGLTNLHYLILGEWVMKRVDLSPIRHLIDNGLIVSDD